MKQCEAGLRILLTRLGIELLAMENMSIYPPTEYSSVIMTVYILPSAPEAQHRDTIHAAVARLQSLHPDALILILLVTAV